VFELRRAASSVLPGELRDRLDEPGLAIVDTRPLHAFNGWHADGARRGGHIPGAAAFPSEWLGSLGDEDVAEVLAIKGLSPDREIVVYGSADDTRAFASRLVTLGYVHIRRLDDWRTWVDDESLPVARLPRYERLVHVEWLRAVLDGRRPEAPPGERVLLFHVNFGVPEEYEESHLPGALHLDTNWLEDSSDWNRRSPDELEAAVRQLGITCDTTVVLYGRDSEGRANEKWPGRRAGQIAASRAALILTYCGVRDVRILDGGYDHWVQAGNELETTLGRPSPVPSFGAAIPVRPEVIVDIDQAREILAARDTAALVSVRTWREHIGEVSGYNYIEPAGRIAGDVWGNCGSDAYHMQHYRNVDNTMRPYPEIAANWEEASITPDKWVAFYCGTGWRASETWFYASLMGWRHVAVYDGGWFEWSKDPERNPIEVGSDATELAA
jgi:thiosulfate/3-mercaptopyruvate sulfurtransferase